jgi:hypothetical protein
MQELNAQILDESTGQPLPGAQVYTTNDKGLPTGIARGDDSGTVQGTVPDFSPNILVTAPGYAAKVIDVGEANTAGYIGLTPVALADGDATSVIKNTTLSGVPWWVWVGAAGGLIYVASKPDRKRVSGAGSDYSKYIIPVAVVVGGYFLLKNFGLFGGTSAADQNAAGITAASQQGVADAISTDQASGGIATINQAQAAGIANTIFNSMSDQDAIVRQLIQVNTLQDLLLTIQAFGTKQAGGAACSLFGGIMSSVCGTYDLPSFVRATLDNSHLATVNNYLSAQNINYQF